MNRQSPPSLYDADIVTWADTQAELLRALSQRPDLGNAIDWENVIEEIETVGRTEVRVVTSAMRLVFIHLIKCLSHPHSLAINHWRAEIILFRSEAINEYVPSMAQKIDMDSLWLQAKNQAKGLLELQNKVWFENLPTKCPFSLKEFLDPALNLEEHYKNTLQIRSLKPE